MAQEEQERRLYNRVSVARPGYCILEDGRYHLCKIDDVSWTGMLVKGVSKAYLGEWVVTGSELGRVEGVVVRSMNDGFALEIARPANQGQKAAGG